MLENCLLRTTQQALGCPYDDVALENVSIQLKRNTFLSSNLVVVVGLRKPLPSDDAPTSRPFRLEASENIFDCWNLVGFVQHQDFLDKAAELEPAEAEAALLRLLHWQGERNLFAAGRVAVTLFAGEPSQGRRRPKSLEQWKRFWESTEIDSQEESPRFQVGNLRALPGPDDFRLRPDSPGYRAGKDGKDLGADVDLVGPGPAYERWKKTPEYQEWLKESGQVKAAAPTPVVHELGQWDRAYASYARSIESQSAYRVSDSRKVAR